MADYIEREAFIKEQRHLYCENCARRKGMKNGKMRFVYEIGDAPCRACGYGDVLDDLEDFPAANVRPVVLCRDCQDSYVWANVDGDNYRYCGYLRSRWNHDTYRMVDDDDFCKWGRKREENGRDT